MLGTTDVHLDDAPEEVASSIVAAIEAHTEEGRELLEQITARLEAWGAVEDVLSRYATAITAAPSVPAGRRAEVDRALAALAEVSGELR